MVKGHSTFAFYFMFKSRNVLVDAVKFSHFKVCFFAEVNKLQVVSLQNYFVCFRYAYLIART